MQSGQAKGREWRLEFEPAAALRPDPLMGWTSTSDMRRQVSLAFDSKEDAVAYAQRHGIAFQVIEPKAPRPIIKAYADNFATDRKVPWTH